MSIGVKLFLRLFVIFFLLAFPLFYFVYKYGHPDFGLNDFYSYYKLYSNWDIDHVDAPFNMRLLSSFFVYVFNKLGFHYNTEISFDRTGLDKQVFFNAVFFNFICVVLTCCSLFYSARRQGSTTLVSFLAGLLYLLGFGTLFYEIMPLTDALSVLLFALAYGMYLKNSKWIHIWLLLLVFQREYVFLALGMLSAIDYLKQRKSYYMQVLAMNVFCFGIYIVLRKTVFYTPTYDHQASTGFFLDSLTQIRFPVLPFIKQTLMTMNISIIYLLIVYYKWRNKLSFDRYRLLLFILLFLQINIISIAAVFGNNNGRYFYILIPFVILQISAELNDIFDGK